MSQQAVRTEEILQAIWRWPTPTRLLKPLTA
jgi:hypothetical protein